MIQDVHNDVGSSLCTTRSQLVTPIVQIKQKVEVVGYDPQLFTAAIDVTSTGEETCVEPTELVLLGGSEFGDADKPVIRVRSDSICVGVSTCRIGDECKDVGEGDEVYAVLERRIGFGVSHVERLDVG